MQGVSIPASQAAENEAENRYETRNRLNEEGKQRREAIIKKYKEDSPVPSVPTSDPTGGKAELDPNLQGDTHYSTTSLTDSIQNDRTEPVTTAFNNEPALLIENLNANDSSITLNMGSTTQGDVISNLTLVDAGGDSSAGNKLGFNPFNMKANAVS